STRVAAWMHTGVHVAHPQDPIDRARAVCERERVNQLPVDADGRMIGIVTDRDLRDAFPSVTEEVSSRAEAHRLTASMRVEDIMKRNVVTLTEEDGIDVAATIMQRERIGALPILRGGQLVG